MKKILLLDANNLIYRARYSSKFAREGDAAIVYSFFRSLKPILEKFKPDVCYFVRDGSRAGRVPRRLAAPRRRLRRVYDAGSPLSDVYGLERDDVIGPEPGSGTEVFAKIVEYGAAEKLQEQLVQGFFEYCAF